MLKKFKSSLTRSTKNKSHQANLEKLNTDNMYPRPGSAEYVVSLLTGPNKVCPHEVKLIPGRESKIPLRLGFFFYESPSTKDVTKWHTPIGGSDLESQFNPVLNLDTSKLCIECYRKAVPEGFDTWSMPYNLKELKTGETTRYGFLPPQLVPGSGPNGFEPWQKRETGLLKPLHNEVALPNTFAYMQYRGRPFYLDIFHLTTPWKKEDDPIKNKRQIERIEMENGIAYENATRILIPDGSGGYGIYSTAEQRIGQDGVDRLQIVPPRWSENPRGEEGTEQWSYIMTLSAENYLYPRPSDGDPFNLDAIPMEEVIQNQIKQQPGLAQSYLSNADRVILDYYSMNPEGTRWPTRPSDHKPVTTRDVDDVEYAMRGYVTHPGKLEKIKLENEQWIRNQWKHRGERPDTDDRSRVAKIRALFQKRNVPEKLWPELPRPGVYDSIEES